MQERTKTLVIHFKGKTYVNLLVERKCVKGN